MLHLITEVGKPGKTERERRHFPDLTNQKSDPLHKPRGRVYIPHGHGEDEPFRPHPPFHNPKYTDCGPDWKSRVRRIPSPHNPDYKPEIWPEPWKSLRPFPSKSGRTADEWILYPEGADATMRCNWEGIHKASQCSSNEISHSTLYGKNRKNYSKCKRNGMPIAAPGDKPYQAVEYSPSFHKLGSTLPVVDFGGGRDKAVIHTFVPLQDLPHFPRESYANKEMIRQKNVERDEVRVLERWRPATPLAVPVVPTAIQEDARGHNSSSLISSRAY